MAKFTDEDLLKKYILETYGGDIDAEFNTSWYGAWYHPTEIKDYKGILDLLG